MLGRFDRRRDDLLRFLTIIALGALAVLSHQIWFKIGTDDADPMMDSLGPVAWALLALFAVTATRYWTLIVLATKDQFRVIAPLSSAAAKALPTVSVIVPAFNEGVTIRASLA
jgi:hypothetical protein